MPRRSAPARPLARYRAKRDFGRTPEPAAARGADPAHRRRAGALSFVVHEHHARRLHDDLRLELDGVLLSWAVPKGPSLDPAVRRLAIRVEDHPLAYADFEGTIPAGQYGAGEVSIWDRGSWEPRGDPHAALAAGKLAFVLHGHKLAGGWELVRTAKPGDRQERWLLLKTRDAHAHPAGSPPPARAAGNAARRDATAADPAYGPGAADAADLRAARRVRTLPASLAPQLATAIDPARAPTGAGWIAEHKFDGYRLLARVQGSRVRLCTRNGRDWTERLGTLASAVAALGLGPAWLDGELVAFDDAGMPDFHRLQNALDAQRSAALVYFAFDAPFLDGMDLRAAPLVARRALLARRLEPGDREHVRFSDDFRAPLAELLDAAARLRLEGVMVKRADARYVAGRTQSWLKVKIAQRQEFVVCGYTERRGASGEIGSLALAVHDENGLLRAVGSVGTGWDAAARAALHRRLRALHQRMPAVANPEAPARRGRAAAPLRWVEPRLVVEVAFAGWTPDGKIRHAVYKGLRSDLPAAEVTREHRVASVGIAPASPATALAASRPAASPPCPRITHGERVVDPHSGLTKFDLVGYYEAVADWMLPHLRDRPVSLVRAPQGIGHALFFQKHPESATPGLTALDARLWPGHSPLLAIDSGDALVAAAQLNAIEIHTWNATVAHIDAPDRVVFDLDPGERVTWAQMREAALLVRTLLDELGLACWLKTSGGKGLHVVVPIVPEAGHATVEAFARAFAAHLARVVPERIVARAGAANRIGKIFVDYLRNGHGATTVAAYSARARPGLGVSMPVDWDELGEIDSGDHWRVANAPAHLARRRDDPWAGYAACRQSLAPAAARLGGASPQTA